MTLTDGKTVRLSDAVILNSLKLPWDSQGMGRRATDSQVCKWTSDDTQRTGTFYQVHITVCSVTGV